MTINIRQSVFETNSSSSHSIIISDKTDGIYDTIDCICDSSDVMVFEGGEFGREWSRSNDPEIKISYCATDNKDNPERLAMLAKVIAEHVGCKEVEFRLTDTEDTEFSRYYYVDHQSANTSSAAFESESILKNFLFNPESWIFTGNDETTPPPNFFDVDPNIQYKYLMEMDGTNSVVKFKELPKVEEIEDAIDSLMEDHEWCSRSYSVSPNQGFEYLPWGRKDLNGNSFSSRTCLDQGIVLLYKTENKYQDGKFLGTVIAQVKTVKFKIVKL